MHWVQAQVTFHIRSVPVSTPRNQVLYLAGSFNNWNPADSMYAFTKAGNEYMLNTKLAPGSIECKVTRGSWATVEGNEHGRAIPNRSYKLRSKNIDLHIAGWEDLKTDTSAPPSSALQNVHIVSDSFWMPQLNRSRKIRIYLPLDYDTALTKRYPVLYMHDGQNLFDSVTSFAGEWGIDESMAALERKATRAASW